MVANCFPNQKYIKTSAVDSDTSRGATTAEKFEGDQGLGPSTGAHAPRTRLWPGWVLGAGGGRPSRCEGPEVSPPENFRKLRC